MKFHGSWRNPQPNNEWSSPGVTCTLWKWKPQNNTLSSLSTQFFLSFFFWLTYMKVNKYLGLLFMLSIHYMQSTNMVNIMSQNQTKVWMWSTDISLKNSVITYSADHFWSNNGFNMTPLNPFFAMANLTAQTGYGWFCGG